MLLGRKRRSIFRGDWYWILEDWRLLPDDWSLEILESWCWLLDDWRWLDWLYGLSIRIRVDLPS